MNSLHAEVIIVGGGLAGLSAGTYLGRAMRDTLLIDAGKSMARWEPEVQNYLGFPNGVGGGELLERGRTQATRYRVKFTRDHIKTARKSQKQFHLRGDKLNYSCERLLICTGIFHIPPEIPEISPCLGHSMFFCKDCDGYRVQGKAVAVYGWRNEAVEYALGMLHYSSCVAIVTDGRTPKWDAQHARWISGYKIPVYLRTIVGVRRNGSALKALRLAGATEVEVDALFTTRGDIYFNKLARGLGAKVDPDGQILVDVDMRTTVPGLYAAGCVTPANCQMIIAAGQGATAAQAINRDILEQSLKTHSLRLFRKKQLMRTRTHPRTRTRTRTRTP